MLFVPAWAAENSYIPLPQVVSHSIFGLFILEGQQIDLHHKTLPGCTAQLLSPDTLITVECQELWLLLQVELPLPEEGEPPEVSLGNCGLPCLLCHLLPQTVCWEWAFLCSDLLSTTSPFLTSPSGASSSKPHIHSSILYAAMGGHHYLHCSTEASWLPCLSSLFHNSFCNGLVTFPVQSPQSPPPELPYQPNWWGPSSWILCPLHYPRDALPCMIINQRIGLPPWGQGLQLW